MTSLAVDHLPFTLFTFYPLPFTFRTMIQYVPTTTDAELLGILQLQQRNLGINLSPEERKSQGYVTVAHTLDILDPGTFNIIER